jgi:hypothetical protein
MNAPDSPHVLIDGQRGTIDARREEIVKLTRDLPRFPTINPPGGAYRPCAEYIGARLRRRGFAVEYVRAEGTPGDDDRYPRINVIARRETGTSGRCVHFNGHIDVVRTGAGWTVHPFPGVIRDGKLFGRGACDMKGGLAAAIVAVEALIDSGIPLPGALEISGTVDEESGGFGGVHYLAERGWFSAPRRRSIRSGSADLDPRVIEAGSVGEIRLMRGSERRHGLAVRAGAKPCTLVRADHALAHAVGDPQREKHLAEIVPYLDGNPIGQSARARILGMHVEHRRRALGGEAAERGGDPLIGRR